MNPDVNKIFNKLKEDKVELSTQKVDLSIDTEVRKLVNDGDTLIRKVIDVNNAVSKANDRFQQAKQDLEKATKFNTDLSSEISLDIKAARAYQNEILKKLKQVENVSQELGIRPNEAFPRYNQATQHIADLDKAIDKLNTAYKNIK